jgi:Zn-dependent peptidase ImmA (M78 family)
VRLRRGFKSEANEIAREVRLELKLRPTDPLDPLRLAEHLAIPIIPLSTLGREAPAMVRHFSRIDRSAFSAITVFDGTARVIVHNDAHRAGRQASNVAHELSHGLLLHPPRPALDGRGCRDWDQEQEAEANWLAGALLVPDEAAIVIVRRGLSLAEAAEVYGVSEQMMRFRLNVTGATLRVNRARRYQSW